MAEHGFEQGDRVRVTGSPAYCDQLPQRDGVIGTSPQKVEVRFNDGGEMAQCRLECHFVEKLPPMVPRLRRHVGG